jgi:hypothetical protein
MGDGIVVARCAAARTVPRLLLQPLPRRRRHRQHARQHQRQHRFPNRRRRSGAVIHAGQLPIAARIAASSARSCAAFAALPLSIERLPQWPVGRGLVAGRAAGSGRGQHDGPARLTGHYYADGIATNSTEFFTPRGRVVVVAVDVATPCGPTLLTVIHQRSESFPSHDRVVRNEMVPVGPITSPRRSPRNARTWNSG